MQHDTQLRSERNNIISEMESELHDIMFSPHIVLLWKVLRPKQHLFMGGLSQLYLMVPHVCEAMVIVLRYLTNDWVIKLDVCRLFSGQVIEWRRSTRQIISCISTEMGISSDLVIRAMHSVN